MNRVEGAREDIYPVVEAVEMWESRGDFQRVWEGWKASSMAFHGLFFRAASVLDKPKCCHVVECVAFARRFR